MSLTSVTFDLPEAYLAALDEIAANLEEGREYVLREAVAQYLADHEWLKQELAEGIFQADAGDTISHEEMLQRFEAMQSGAREKQAA